jgi:uncharacterized protein
LQREHCEDGTFIFLLRLESPSMQTTGTEEEIKPAKVKPAAKPQSGIGKRWRAWLRAAHRDIGYLAVGFTIIYAVSGIAVNHLGDWDPKFISSQRETTIAAIPADVPDDEAFDRVIAALRLDKPKDTFRAGDEIRLTYEHSEVTVIGDSGSVTVSASKPRWFFHAVVWLHTARSKPAWKYIADIYAVLLLYLAISGIFMIKGRLGLKWRGLVLVGTGIAVPVMYVVLSGGPSAKPEKDGDKTQQTESSDESDSPPERPPLPPKK